MEEKAPDTAGAKPSLTGDRGKINKTPMAILGEVGTPMGGVYPNEVGGGVYWIKRQGVGGQVKINVVWEFWEVWCCLCGLWGKGARMEPEIGRAHV